MGDDVNKVLDICLNRMKRGETIEGCLADYPQHAEELRPLLEAAGSLLSFTRISLPHEDRRLSQSRLLARIQAESPRPVRETPAGAGLSGLLHRRLFRTLVPVALVMVIAVIIWIALPIFSPQPVYAKDLTLSIIQGRVEILTPGSSGWSTGDDGMRLSSGSKVRTSAGSLALLTFFDSSTTRLEPETQVLVQQSDYINEKSVRILLEQEAGKTWSYVLSGGETDTYFAIQTARLKAIARGTAFSLSVDTEGNTGVSVAEGAVRIDGLREEINLLADQKVLIETDVTQAAPLAIPAPEDKLIVSTGLAAVSSVSAPNGASTGMLPDGLAFNQITDSKSVLHSSGQYLTVDEPASGDYLVTIRPLSRQAVPVDIQVKHEEHTVFRFTETLRDPGTEGWIIRIKIDRESSDILTTSVASIADLTGKGPEKVVETELAKQRITPIATPVPAPSPETKDPGDIIPLLTPTEMPELSPVQTATPTRQESQRISAPTTGATNAISTTEGSDNTSPASTATPEIEKTTTPAVEITPTATPTPVPSATPESNTEDKDVLEDTSSSDKPSSLEATPEATKTPTVEKTDSTGSSDKTGNTGSGDAGSSDNNTSDKTTNTGSGDAGTNDNNTSD
ncbi:MAG: FecR domain-containing protein, partial [Dehalococcoidales bacterium]|nr:FecR domain-containing protein [Dehalococcoidales bacterium]